MRLLKKKPVEPIRTCAFCGGIPRLTKCGNQKEYLVYQCANCYETPVRLDEARLTESAARKIWNERTEFAEYIIKAHNRVNRWAIKEQNKETP
jgi:hypothetical protein